MRKVTEMPTTQQITDIVEKVRKRLAEGEREGRDLIVREASTRRPVVAATRRLADELLGEAAL